MKEKKTVFLFVMACWILVLFPVMEVQSISTKAPSFSATSLEDESFKFEPLQKKLPTLVVFWATWCKSCKYEIPELIDLHKEKGSQLEILGISVDQNPEKARQYAQKVNLPYTNLKDPDAEIARLFAVRLTPTLILVGPQGEIAYRSNRLDKSFRAKVDALLQPSK